MKYFTEFNLSNCSRLGASYPFNEPSFAGYVSAIQLKHKNVFFLVWTVLYSLIKELFSKTYCRFKNDLNSHRLFNSAQIR